LLPTEVYNEIYDVLSQYGAWPTLGVKRVGTKSVNFPVKTARAKGGFFNYTSGGKLSQDNNKAGGKAPVTIQTGGVLLDISNDLIEDTEVDIVGDVLNDFGEAFSEGFDYACFLANGSTTVDGDGVTDGGMTGIVNAGTSLVAATGHNTTALLTYDDVRTALTGVAATVLSRRPKWWIHPGVLAQLLGVKDNNGRPIFQSAFEAPSYGAMGSICGYPVIPTSVLPATPTASQPWGIFGDGNGQVAAIRRDITIENSRVGDTAWTSNSTSFRGVSRVGTANRAATAFAVMKLAA
jgi:HK97 family phage major capsid protein